MACSFFSFIRVTFASSPLLLGTSVNLSTHFENIPCLFLILGVRDQQNIVLVGFNNFVSIILFLLKEHLVVYAGCVLIFRK